MHVARIAEEVRGSPEEFDPGPLHLFLGGLDHLIEVLVAVGQLLAFRGDVSVVEAEERGAELFHELEADTHAVHGILDRVLAGFPRAEHRAGAERVGAGATKRVPIGDAEPQLVLHRLAFHLLVRVVVAEGQRVLRVGAFKSDLLDVRKCGGRGHGVSPKEIESNGDNANRLRAT